MFCGENVGKFGQHGSVHILERERESEREKGREKKRVQATGFIRV